MTTAVAEVPTRLPVEAAARLGHRRRARLLVVRLGSRWGAVTPATLEHARRLGLGTAPVRAVLWLAPAVAPGTPEVLVRRVLGPGTPFVLVNGAEGPMGAVLGDTISRRALPLSVTDRLDGLPERVLRILRRAGALGDERGVTVAAVGGLVRDLFLHRRAPARLDLDLTVEGDARTLARSLAEKLDGDIRDRVREHPAFLTATVDLAAGQRVDVTAARRERYRTPGALPDVEPASLTEDLWRRDVSVNALAVRLNAATWGEVVDPTGGVADLRRRRIRVLHPLSFVEDPTRLFRAVRFAVRLGFGLDGPSRHLFIEAARLPAYDALSGDRLRAELKFILREADPQAVLARLGRMGAFRLLLPGYRFGAGAGRRLERVAHSVRELPMTVGTRELLYVLALTDHLAPETREQWTTRLGVPLGAREAMERARREAGEILARLADAGGPGEAYTVLRRIPEVSAAWGHVRARRVEARISIERYLEEWRAMRPIVTGDDLQAMGLVPGPAVGRLLDDLRVAQAAGRVRSRRGALAWARAALARRGAGSRRSSVTNPTRPGMRGG